jgi:hypothetical protein
MAIDLAPLIADATWLAHRFDPEGDTVHFRAVPREAHRKATFLTDEYLGEDANPVVVRRAEALALSPPAAPTHFIFHSAFCCSTLLARAFDLPGVSMGLKEPVIVNDIVGWRLRGADGRRVAEALDHALGLLARPFEAGEATIVKPSNVANGLAPAMMGLRPEAKALLLSAPLPVFLKSIAKKGMWGRLWVRDLLVKQLREGFIDLGFEQADYLGLTDLQAAAVGWLAQHASFARMATEFGPQRVRTLDSETLLDRPGESVATIAALFGIALDGAQLSGILAGPAFATDSKTGDAFSVSARAAGYNAAAQHHADEIEKVLFWAEAVATNAGVTMEAPLPLLGLSHSGSG